MPDAPPWWAKGTLYESCNCRLLCRCHISYRQPADHERCIGYLAAHIAEGRYADAALDGLRAVLLVDAPRIMTTPGWTVALYIDERADAAQRAALEAIFGGRAGSGWAVLASLVGERLETRFLPIAIEHDGAGAAVRVAGVLEASLTPTRGADKAGPVRLENVHNQVHGPSQVLAWGRTRLADRGRALDTEDTHALYSPFSWHGP